MDVLIIKAGVGDNSPKAGKKPAARYGKTLDFGPESVKPGLPEKKLPSGKTSEEYVYYSEDPGVPGAEHTSGKGWRVPKGTKVTNGAKLASEGTSGTSGKKGPPPVPGKASAQPKPVLRPDAKFNKPSLFTMDKEAHKDTDITQHYEAIGAHQHDPKLADFHRQQVQEKFSSMSPQEHAKTAEKLQQMHAENPNAGYSVLAGAHSKHAEAGKELAGSLPAPQEQKPPTGTPKTHVEAVSGWEARRKQHLDTNDKKMSKFNEGEEAAKQALLEHRSKKPVPPKLVQKPKKADYADHPDIPEGVKQQYEKYQADLATHKKAHSDWQRKHTDLLNKQNKAKLSKEKAQSELKDFEEPRPKKKDFKPMEDKAKAEVKGKAKAAKQQERLEIKAKKEQKSNDEYMQRQVAKESQKQQSAEEKTQAKGKAKEEKEQAKAAKEGPRMPVSDVDHAVAQGHAADAKTLNDNIESHLKSGKLSEEDKKLLTHVQEALKDHLNLGQVPGTEHVKNLGQLKKVAGNFGKKPYEEGEQTARSGTPNFRQAFQAGEQLGEQTSSVESESGIIKPIGRGATSGTAAVGYNLLNGKKKEETKKSMSLVLKAGTQIMAGNDTTKPGKQRMEEYEHSFDERPVGVLASDTDSEVPDDEDEDNIRRNNASNAMKKSLTSGCDILKAFSYELEAQLNTLNPLEAEFAKTELGYSDSDIRKGLVSITGYNRHRLTEWLLERAYSSVSTLVK